MEFSQKTGDQEEEDSPLDPFPSKCGCGSQEADADAKTVDGGM